MANSNSVFSLQYNLFFNWPFFRSDFSCYTSFVKVYWGLVLQLSDIYYYLRYIYYHYKFCRHRNYEICFHCTPVQSIGMGAQQNSKAISGRLYNNSLSNGRTRDGDERFRILHIHKNVFRNEKWRLGKRYLEAIIFLPIERNGDRWITKYSSSKWYTDCVRH